MKASGAGIITAVIAISLLPSVDSVCRQGDFYESGSCYLYYSQTTADAITNSRICSLKKASTVSAVTYSVENVTTHFRIRSKEIWLGIQRDPNNSTYYFNNGTVCPVSVCLNSTFWMSGHPRSSRKKVCVSAKVASGVYRWRSRSCSVKRRVLCEYPPLLGPPPNITRVCGVPSLTNAHAQIYTSASMSFCSLTQNDSVAAVTQRAKTTLSSVGDMATVVNFAAEKAIEVATNLNFSVSTQEADELLDLFDVILDPPNANFLSTLSTSSNLLPDLLDTMEFFASSLAFKLDGNTSFTMDKQNFHLQTQTYNTTSSGSQTFVLTSGSNSADSTSILVSNTAFSGMFYDLLSVSFITYKNIYKQFPEPNLNSTNFQFGSERVVAISLYSEFSKLDARASFAIPKRQVNYVKNSIKCVYLDIDNSTDGAVWSERGCGVLMSNTSHVGCVCNHTTNYAVLMQVTDVEQSAEHSRILSIITYIGTGLSIICLIVALVIFVLTSSNVQIIRLKIHQNLCVSLLMFQSVFLLGAAATYQSIVCSITAVVTQYLGLTSFMWMLLEGIHLLRTIILVYGSESTSMLTYHLLAWLCPLAPVAVGLAISHTDYGSTQGTCWLNNAIIWTFVAPVIIITVFNFITMALVIRTVVKASSGKNKEHAEGVKVAIKSFVLIAPLLGLTWIFGVLAFTEHLLFFHYVFAVTNSLQGVFILVFCVFLSTEVRTSLNRKFKRMRDQSRDFSKKSGSKVASSESGNSGRGLLHASSTPLSALSSSGYESDEFTSVSRIPSAAPSINKAFQHEMSELNRPDLRPPTPLRPTQDVSLKITPAERPQTQESVFSVDILSDAGSAAPGTPDYMTGTLSPCVSRPGSASRPGSSGSARVSSPLTPATKPAAVVRPLRRTKRQQEPKTHSPVTKPWLSEKQSATAEVDFVLTAQKATLHSKKKKKSGKKSSIRPPTPQKQNMTPRTVLYDMEF